MIAGEIKRQLKKTNEIFVGVIRFQKSDLISLLLDLVTKGLQLRIRNRRRHSTNG